MTNEEKAKILTGFDVRLYEMHKEDAWAEDETDREKYEIALEMAEWKDNQFKEYLIGKGADYELAAITDSTYKERANAITEIINDLFGEEDENEIINKVFKEK